jgi:hypothetical protein
LDLPEVNTYSFIIKIWFEETAEETGRVVWRGHITHVPSGKRQYLKNLDEILIFIVPYLEDMGTKLTFSWRLRQWLKQPKLFWKRHV